MADVLISFILVAICICDGVVCAYVGSGGYGSGVYGSGLDICREICGDDEDMYPTTTTTKETADLMSVTSDKGFSTTEGAGVKWPIITGAVVAGGFLIGLLVGFFVGSATQICRQKKTTLTSTPQVASTRDEQETNTYESLKREPNLTNGCVQNQENSVYVNVDMGKAQFHAGAEK